MPQPLGQYMQPHHYAQPHPPPALPPAQGSPYFNPPPAPRTPHCQLFVLVTLNRFKSWKWVTTFLVARIGDQINDSCQNLESAVCVIFQKGPIVMTDRFITIGPF